MTATLDFELSDARQGKNTRGVRSYTRVFRVVTDSQSDGPYVVGSATGLPLIGSVHNEDPGAWCYELTPENTDPWRGWTVSALYDSVQELNENPLNEPAVIEWDGENFDEALVVDRNGHAVLNSAGDPFENAMRERTRRVVMVMKNVDAVPTWMLDAEDAVNDAMFTLDGFFIPANKAKIGAPKLGRWQTRNGTRYREMHLMIKLNKDGWNFKPLDAGFRFRNGANELVRITSDDGTDITTPVCLDGSGAVLSDPTPSTAVYGDVEQYPEFDFSTLPLT